jgi:hypothetical protein
VEKVWTERAKAVENLTSKKNVVGKCARSRAARPCGTALRAPLRLIGGDACVESRGFPSPRTRKRGVTVHRFEENIGGRTYQIEVTPVSNRWRAQICRIPGMPTALMPFYGQTPDEAARQLSQWLVLAHRRHSVATVQTS